MATVTSLGVHKPSAVPFLVSEGVLQADPPEDAYTWHTIWRNGQGCIGEEEELVTTKHCVVWSRGGVIQRVFRFEVEEEPITQAVFTLFPSQSPEDSKKTSNLSQKSTVGGAPTTNGELKVRKQRASNSKSRLRADSETTQSVDELPHFQSLEGSSDDDQSLDRRALVVVLKTKAHIFFLSETKHIVNLPFEVDAVFPSIYGIFLQRKLPEKPAVAPTPQLPSVPFNSFAVSQSSQPHATLANLSTGEDLNSPFLPLLERLLQQSSQGKESGLPRLFCLADPLAEIGTVATKDRSSSKGTLRPQAQRSSTFENLDPGENLLYVSARDELTQSAAELSKKGPLILAVTENEETRALNIWTANYVDHGASKNRQRQPTPTASGVRSRRRSSYAPGMGTGTTTPTIKDAASGRESFSGTRSRRHPSNDPSFEDSAANDYDDLLDPVFGNPAMPAKSARRVSGLLARADLSTKHDRASFSDLATTHPGKKGARKGASFGAHGARLSTGPDAGNSLTKAHNLNGIQTSLDSVSLYEQSFDDRLDESDDMHDLKSLGDAGFHDAVRGLRKEIVFSKVYSMPGEGRKARPPTSRAKNPALEVITIKSPNSSLGDASDDAAIMLYLIDRVAHELVILRINVKFARPADPSYPPQAESGSRFEEYNARVSGLTRRSGVLDACKLGDCLSSRILVLGQSSDGAGDLSLEAPWSSPRKVGLPANLLLHNPYQITSDGSLRLRREGGFRRVLSQGPKALVALQHGSCGGRVDVVDSDGIKHRLEVQLRPRNPFIRRLMKVSESVLPTSEVDGETILRGWWDAMSWLQTHHEGEMDSEWTAMVVILFSMGVAFMPDRRTEATTRQKRRKSGLLRSSSGANTDLESWEMMLIQEGGSSGTSPAWIHGPAWQWTAEDNALPHVSPSKRSRSSNSNVAPSTAAVPIPKKSAHLLHCISIARDFMKSTIGQAANGDHGYLPTASSRDPSVRRIALASILVGIHLLREEMKLDVLAAETLHQLTPVLAQIGTWLGWEAWSCKGSSYYMLESIDMDNWLFEESAITGLKVPAEPFQPPSILHFIEMTQLKANPQPIISLLDIASSPEGEIPSKGSAEPSARLIMDLTPRTVAITNLLSSSIQESIPDRVTKMASWGLSLSLLESLPESVAVSFRAAMSSCQAQPSMGWDSSMLKMVGRDDMAILNGERRTLRPHGKTVNAPSTDAVHDIHSICHATLEIEAMGPHDGSAELDRLSITRLLFKDDQRFAEAAKLVHPLLYPTARCTPEPEWSDTDLLEAQQELVKVIAMRTMSVSHGRGLLFYSARSPLLTEKFPIHGFTLSCVMKPADTTVTADRNSFTEEKTAWAFFHAGVEAGLSISKDAKGIDTSWILFNKPRELTTRHAGFLLALGLNGHLKSIAKWVAFKYLTPKHTMTSIGLLLGLSASYIGTMDTLITRLLSVHVTRMLPPGAAELNLSPLTQTSGIMGIGLLYCNTQHRRMSEIMLSEMENTDEDDSVNPMENLRDEGYRLAAGFALGYINLGKGKDLKGLHDMHMVERLLVLAIGTRKVSIVHLLDKATAAANVAIALVFMRTHDEALARKIDIPDTIHQFDYVRPDMFLLRTLARNLIMWDSIQANSRWIKMQLPLAYEHRADLTTIRILTSEDLPFFNIVAGLCLSIGLRFAGSGSLDARNVLCHCLDQFMRICRLPTLNYDGKLTRITVRNCQDVVALAASCVMAGTGDLHIFRRLRYLHGRTDADTPFGSHLAGHFAIGVLFLGGGTHTFGTSNLAIASLICAFYPLFPNTVLENRFHLQAFRHFWVLATECRCLVTRDVDTQRPVSLPILVKSRTGTEIAMTAPCILPEVETIAKIQTDDPEHWRVILDIANNQNHYEAFKRHQSIYVRRRAAYEAHASVFSATMQALNDAQSTHQLGKQVFRWIFALPSLAGFDRAEQAVVLPAEAGSLVYKGTRGTVVDDMLVLERTCMGSGRSERLWNLRILYAWAEGVSRRGEEFGWLGQEVVEGLRAGLALRRWEAKGR
jgi:anaphase-promoting complex subunit 1